MFLFNSTSHKITEGSHKCIEYGETVVVFATAAAVAVAAGIRHAHNIITRSSPLPALTRTLVLAPDEADGPRDRLEGGEVFVAGLDP